MNNVYLDLLEKTMISEMAKEINKRLSEEDKEPINDTPEEVFKNLPMLYETVQETAFGEPTGNSYRYMPKRYKAMVMRLVAPDYYPEVKVSYNKAEDGTLIGVCAEAKLYLNHEDNKPVAFGKQYLSYSAAQGQKQFDDDSNLHAYAESTVRGIAQSKAFQDFGIGSWYSYQFEPEENPDAALAAMADNDGIKPTVAYGDDKEQADDNTTSAPDTVSETEPVTEEPEAPESSKQEAKSQPQEAETGKKPDAPTEAAPAKDSAKASSDKAASKNNGRKSKSAKEGSMTIEEARARKAPFGRAAEKDLTLGETEVQYPGNILWMYTQPNIADKDKEALVVIALNNPKLLDYFNEKGVTIEQD